MNKKRLLARILCIIMALAMVLGSAYYLIYIISPAELTVYADDKYQKLDQLKDVIKIIDQEYKEDIDVNKLIDAAYAGVFNELDPWSVYYETSSQKDQFVDSLSQEEFCGIGVVMTGSGAKCIITSLLPDSPAKKAGIKIGDIIVKVDGQDVKTWSLDDIQAKVRGKEGTSVKLAVKRGDSELEFNLVRAMLKSTDVTYDILEAGKIGYIKISEFSEGTADNLYKAKMEIAANGVKSFIIDLRNNPGGYMDEATEAASLFLKDGDPLLYLFKDGKEIDHSVVKGNGFGKYKVILLVNENSASASEIFAAILKDNKAATLVGTNTYGKGVAQQIIPIGNDSYMKLSICYFTGPSKEKIDGVGVKPDYIVYENANLSEEEINKLTANIIPMNEGKKYQTKGQYGLNVLAAQQRLKALGYDIETSSILDDKTMNALKDVQQISGLYPYGGLDFSTINALSNMYETYFHASGDIQLEKAIELLK